MHKSYKSIDEKTANSIKLIMTDVDGTLLASGRDVSPEVEETLRLLQRTGIIIGLVSGRTLGELEKMALHLGLTGPIIAENGGVAKPCAGKKTFDLGYSRTAAEEAFRKLRETFPDDVQGREDNDERTIDMVIRTNGILPDEMRKHIGTTQLLDSGYIMHLMQEGISKGKTLERLLGGMIPGNYRWEEVMVLGDSATDASLFESFPLNVLILNPNLPSGQPELMKEKAAYISEKEYGEGFVEVALHIVNLRNQKLKTGRELLK